MSRFSSANRVTLIKKKNTDTVCQNAEVHAFKLTFFFAARCLNHSLMLLNGQTVTTVWTQKEHMAFVGRPSEVHRFSSIPLILVYNVYSQVNWTGTSLWAWRSLLRGSGAGFLPKHAYCLNLPQHLKEVQLFLQYRFMSDCARKVFRETAVELRAVLFLVMMMFIWCHTLLNNHA